MTKPFTPDEAIAAKVGVIPPEVLDVWNTILAKHFDGISANFNQDEVVAALVAATGVERHQVFENKWLDVEALYRSYGWKVEYDKPGYNESYAANFTFRRAK